MNYDAIDYDALPVAVRNFIPATRDHFLSYPLKIRRMIIDQAYHLFNDSLINEPDPIPQVSIDLSSWSSYSEYYYRTFIGFRYQDYLYGIRHTSPLILTSENVHSLYHFIEHLSIDQQPDREWTAYQLTLTTSTGYINSSIGSFISVVISRTERYNDAFLEIFDICIRYTNSSIRGGDRLVHAGQGEGIPYSVGSGFWLLDLYPSRSRCIINCYLLWQMYKKDPTLILNKSYFLHLQKQFKTVSCIADLPLHPYTILYLNDFNNAYNDIKNISPVETLLKAHYVYLNSHMFLLIHEAIIIPYPKTMNFIINKSKQTTLHKIKNKNIPQYTSEIHVMDIESLRHSLDNNTNTYKHVPLMIGHTDHHYNYMVFKGDDCLDKYVLWLSLLNRSLFIWAHNGGNYDFHLLLNSLMKISHSSLDVPIEILDVDGRFIQLKVFLKSGCFLCFRDSYALIPGSLNKITKEFGVEGKLPDIDIAHVTRDQLLYDSVYEEYNKQDCRALLDVLSIYRQKGIDEFGIDPLNHPSASSYAKRIFYSRYYDKNNSPLYSLPQHVHTYLYQSYGGGRCEVFIRGHIHKDLFHYDINSSYPYAGTMSLPYDKPIYHPNLEKIIDVKSFLINHPGFYKVKILNNNNNIPIHGVMHQGKYIFPQFTHNSPSIIVFSEELLYGLTCGYCYKLLDGYEFKMSCWAKTFFTDMYNKKLEAKNNKQYSSEFIRKITINSAYGFFGYNKYNRNVVRIYGRHMLNHTMALEYQSQCTFFEYDNTLLSYEKRNVLLDDVNIAVASAITSYARIHLHKLMSKVEILGGNLYYVDTDSIITDIKLENMESDLLGHKLGQLKNECPEGIEDAVFVSCKLYGYKPVKGDPKVHAKGVKKCTKELYDILINLLSTSQTFDVWSMITSRIKKAKGDLNVYDMIIEKQLSGYYTKRIVLENGTTKPITF